MTVHWSLELKEAPALEPVTVADAKKHLRLPASIEHDDTYIEGLIAAGREKVESWLQRALITQTLVVRLDHFPGGPIYWPGPRSKDLEGHDPVIRLPRAPVQSITAIRYLAAGGTVETLSSDRYRADVASQPARITPEHGQSWPVTRAGVGAVDVEFIAGYGDAPEDVPQAIRHALKMFVGTWYDPARTNVVLGTIATQIPMSAEYLLGPYRLGLQAGQV